MIAGVQGYIDQFPVMPTQLLVPIFWYAGSNLLYHQLSSIPLPRIRTYKCIKAVDTITPLPKYLANRYTGLGIRSLGICLPI